MIKLLGILFFLGMTGNICAVQKDVLDVGKVTADRVNVRSGPSLSYDILTKSNKNDVVFIVARDKEWCQIQLSEDTSLWIHEKLLKQDGETGVVLKEGVNIRAKPSIKSSIVCQLQKGDVVQLRDKKYEWWKIKAPAHAFGWLHGKFIEHYLSFETYQKLQREEGLEALIKKAAIPLSDSI